MKNNSASNDLLKNIKNSKLFNTKNIIQIAKQIDKYKFKILYLNRNIRRKNPGDCALAYKHMMDQLTPEQRKEYNKRAYLKRKEKLQKEKSEMENL